MNIQNAMNISAFGMRAQGTRIQVIAENLANAGSAPTRPGEAPYRRKMVSFEERLQTTSTGSRIESVAIGRIHRDQTEFPTVYDPSHPAADENGYVKMPNITPLIELTDMREAHRSYEANLSTLDLSKSMLLKTIDLLRG